MGHGRPAVERSMFPLGYSHISPGQALDQL